MARSPSVSLYCSSAYHPFLVPIDLSFREPLTLEPLCCKTSDIYSLICWSQRLRVIILREAAKSLFIRIAILALNQMRRGSYVRVLLIIDKKCTRAIFEINPSDRAKAFGGRVYFIEVSGSTSIGSNIHGIA